MQNKTGDFIKKSKKIHGDKYDYSLSIYTTSKNKLTIICPKHGEFSQRASSHIGKQKQGCKMCANDSYKKGLDFFLKNAKKIHGESYDYSLIKDVYFRKPSEIICPKHGIFKQTPYHHIYRKQKCPKCSSTNKNTDEFIYLATLKHKNLYDYSLVKYVNNKTKVKIICKNHGTFIQQAGSHLQGSGCPICKESKGEKEIKFFLTDNDLCFERQKTFLDCKNIFLLSFDFYIPHLNTCIEFNGRQHYEPIRKWGGELALEKQKNNDKIKKEYCVKNNIPLVIIKYNENIKEKLSLILK